MAQLQALPQLQLAALVVASALVAQVYEAQVQLAAKQGLQAQDVVVWQDMVHLEGYVVGVRCRPPSGAQSASFGASGVIVKGMVRRQDARRLNVGADLPPRGATRPLRHR